MFGIDSMWHFAWAQSPDPTCPHLCPPPAPPPHPGPPLSLLPCRICPPPPLPGCQPGVFHATSQSPLPHALRCCTLQSAKAKAQQAQQAKAAVSWQMTMAAKAADLLRCIVDQALDRPPAATLGKLTHVTACHAHFDLPASTPD